MYKKYINRKRFPAGGLALFLFMIFLHVSTLSFAQQKRITLNEVNVPLKSIIKKIKSQTGVGFIVTTSMLAEAKPVTIKVNNAELNFVLQQIFKDQPLTYTIRKNSVALTRKVTTRSNVGLTEVPSGIRGTIRDESGNPVIGASVGIEGSGQQSMSDSEGKFLIREMSVGGTLVVSHIAYERKMVPLTGQNDLQLTMTPAINNLAGVAVVSTGYQNIDKVRATGSFAKPDMEIFKNRVGTMDIANRLEGLVPGLLVKKGFNGAGASDAGIPNGKTTQNVTIRGGSSISLNTNPLYVVDGVPVTNINQFNPDDIEDVTVLKDAAAAAIWGARASNGVVVINTKKALKNASLNISYNGFFNFQGKPVLSHNKQMNSAQFIEAAREVFDANQFPYEQLAYDVVAPHEQLLYDHQLGKINEGQLNRGLDSLSAINNSSELKDLLYQNATTQNHTVSISGGTNIYSFYTSAAYTSANSSAIGAGNKTYRMMLNQEYNPIKRIKLNLSATLGYSADKAANSREINGNFLPYQLFQDNNGANVSLAYLQGLSPEIRSDYEQRSKISLDFSPLDDLYTKKINVNNLHLNVAGGVQLKLLKGLNFQGNYGIQNAPGKRKDYTDHSNYRLRRDLVGMTVAPTASSIPVYYLPTTGGTYLESNYEERNWTLRNQLVYSTLFRTGKDQLNLQLGHEAREQLGRNTTTRFLGYDEQLQKYFTPTLNNVYLPNTVTGGTYISSTVATSFYETQSRFNSYFALLNYTFERKYSFDGSWRVDHSALFGSDKSAQNKPTYSIGGKWNIQKERFMETLKWVDGLSLRVTYGITGNSPAAVGASQYDILLTPFFMSTPLAGMYANLSPKNDKLSWESTATTNIGLDFSFFGARFGGGLDAYHKKTTDLLGTIRINPLNGFPDGFGNIGNMDNKGVELSLRSINIKSKDFSWASSFNMAYNKNKLLSYSKQDPRANNASSRLQSLQYLVGYELQPLFSYAYAGLNSEGDPMIRLADGTLNSTPYAEKVEDLVYSGSTIPKYTGGFGNTFSYKAFSLAANMVFNLGNVMRADVNRTYTGRISASQDSYEGNLNVDFLNRWKKAGDEAFTNIPRYIPGYETYNRSVEYYTQGDVNVVSAAYAKIRDITLSYRLPELFLRKIKVKTANIALQATNFMVWKANNRGIDPEFHDLTSGQRILAPYNHSYSISTSITF
ncbi:SusC/RagA family TonB-linked outer membrane protein [Pedobacter sp. MC2016-14]|uniref:SusC/RagA family TonB-linked outer membrane protein n=1 Tax=Pedobacter sp. MC2016-14 TaxID=2897327 RepID=UPI001E318252|nr:SusC/RagA family TonB-linked outer membrane protein [Pedobacter sp. MC2016-14]MCD0487593.1 SusC/RagA family TonB-linked outer membrane protein [Pedobacter sp. MC2016-14]